MKTIREVIEETAMSVMKKGECGKACCSICAVRRVVIAQVAKQVMLNLGDAILDLKVSPPEESAE